MSATQDFDVALTGDATVLHLDDGGIVRLPARRWHAAACSGDRWLLGRCHGATLDLGCGPGRLVEALFARGVPALGVDSSPLAIRHCHARGMPALHGDLFARLPAEGHWQHIVLADGNIGIGGNPGRLLDRAQRLLRPGGSILLELTPGRTGTWRGHARFDDPNHRSGHWFPWAVTGLAGLEKLTHHTTLRTVEVHRGQRHFAELAVRN